jgi:hypothetical protein
MPVLMAWMTSWVRPVICSFEKMRLIWFLIALPAGSELRVLQTAWGHIGVMGMDPDYSCKSHAYAACRKSGLSVMPLSTNCTASAARMIPSSRVTT